MSAIEWDPALATGNDLVDQQHRNIHEVSAELDALEPGDLSGFLAAVDRLLAHVDAHFATEEDLMTAAGYPQEATEEHVREHRELRDGARDLVLDFRSGRHDDYAVMADFVRDWLADHVHDRDRLFVEFVRAREGADTPPR
jgi:hemerythrin